jgi:hypothetical protein
LYFTFLQILCFWKWNKSPIKNLQKKYFYNLEPLFEDIWNRRLSRNSLVVSIKFSWIFYFMNQISSFYTISMIIINTKINFCILLFYEFYVFWKWKKVQLKIYKKNIFVIWSLYLKICEMNNSVKFYSEFRLYLVMYFILWIKLVHFIRFRWLSSIQKLIFIFYFFTNFMFLGMKQKSIQKFIKKNIFLIWSLCSTICEMDNSVKFYSEFQLYLMIYFIL